MLLGIEHRVLHILGKNFTTELYIQNKENLNVLLNLVFIILFVIGATLIRKLTFEVVQLVECLPSKHRAQDLIPSTL